MTVTEDALLGGRLRFRQRHDGYRPGMDAALLAAACDAGPEARVLDLGCGAGAVMLAAAVRRPGALFVGLERDAATAALASENIALNGLGDRMEARAFDVAAGFAALTVKPFDAALANPPFFDDRESLRGPSPAKDGAWFADAGLAGWVTFLLRAVRQGGAITMIHRADRLGDILGALAPKAGSIQIRPVQPRVGAAAKRVIVRAIRTGRAPLRLLPALILHDDSGAKHTAEAEAIFRGEPLGWA
jgi:tRNA1(Val) A37 N6-methylase TrmN6